MIMPDPVFQLRQAAATAEAVRRVLLLLYHGQRTRSEDAALLQAAHAAWEGATISGQVAQRISAGLLLAQVQRALGQSQAAVVTAACVRRLAHGTRPSLAATVRALAVGAQAWHDQARPEHAEHLLLLAHMLIETIPDPVDRRRIAQLTIDADAALAVVPPRPQVSPDMDRRCGNPSHQLPEALC